VAEHKHWNEHLVKTFGPKEGNCNICGKFAKLTEDHTPPKSCRGLKDGALHRLHERLSRDSNPRGRRVQNGHSYRTLCAHCNNTLLGKHCDPALAHFCAQIRSAYEAPGWPIRFTAEITPQKVMRSVLGHLSAMGVGRSENGKMTQPLRNYLLNCEEPLPRAIRIYYWLYRSPIQVLVRDAAVGWPGNGITPFTFWLMKFYPLAFLVTFNEPEKRAFSLTALDQYGSLRSEAKRVVPVELYPMIPDSFPEIPTNREGHMILYGEEAVVAAPPATVRNMKAPLTR
jgi:hypothetical protein